MKLWTMPKVLINQFRTNEYVAACTVNIASDFKHADFNGDGKIPHSSLFPNDNENIEADGSYTIGLVGTVTSGWHENIIFYKNYLPGIYLLSPWSYYGDTGPYDVYVFDNGTAKVFKKGSYEKETPERAQLHS